MHRKPFRFLPIEGRVTFSHVDFSYEDDVKILDDVSFDIKPGETMDAATRTYRCR